MRPTKTRGRTTTFTKAHTTRITTTVMGNLFHKRGELYKTLTDELVDHLRQITGFTVEEIRSEHEKFFSLTDDGRLKKSHLEELIGIYLPPTKKKRTKYLTDCVFSAIDTNDDGYIDFIEYLMSVKFFQSQSPIEKADFVFRIIDKNGDRLVTVKEIERILKCLQVYHQSLSSVQINEMISDGPKPAAQNILQRLDEDHSGLIGVSEFVDGWLKDETIRALFTF